MVRVILEISLPAETVPAVAEVLAAGRLGPGSRARLERSQGGSGCSGPAVGGEARWTPCWISVEWDRAGREQVAQAMERLKRLLALACSRGGMELFAVPASAQVGEGFYRVRDLLDVAGQVG